MSIGKLLRRLSEVASKAHIRRVLNNAAFQRLVIAIRIGQLVNVLRYIFWAVSSIPWRPRHRERAVGARLKRWKTPLRGKRGLIPREKTEKPSVFRCNFYFHVLRLPWPLFLMCFSGTYLLTIMIFAVLYYQDVDGLHVETDWPWAERILSPTGRSMLTVFRYSYALSTNSETTVDAHSVYTSSFGYVQALVTQFLSVFWTSAFCDRISQPVKVVRWSIVGVISGDMRTSPQAGIASPKKYRVLTFRFDLLGAYTAGLIDAKFNILCLNSSLDSLLSSTELALVRKEASSVSRGSLLQHVIDETSPLFGSDLEALASSDYIFEVSVRAMEKTTMKQVFSEHHYSVHDGEILWEREFEDQIYSDEDGHVVYDFTLLDSVRAVKSSQYSGQTHSDMKPRPVPSERGNPRFWKCLLWVLLVFSSFGKSSTGVKTPPKT